MSHSTPVLTYNRGWTTHGDLKIGDQVFGLDGKPTEIIGVSPEKYCDRLLTFTDGSKILAHEGHLWSVHKRGNREKELQVISTRNIEKDFIYKCKNGKNREIKERYRYHLPLIEPLYYNEKDLPIDPYWLGRWLGDGTSSSPSICYDESDNQFLDYVHYTVSSTHKSKNSNVYTSIFGYQDLSKKLKELNLYKNKHIPEIYKCASFSQRCELLAGLIDSKGSVDKQGRVRFVNVNKTLIDDYFELCTGLGLYPYYHSPVSPEKANNYKKDDSLNIVARQTVYCVGFQPRFSLPTTVSRKKIVEKGLRRKIAIANVEKVTDGEIGKCIEVEADDGIYLVGKNLIPTHNSKSSMVTLAFPLWILFQDPNVNIMIVTGSPKLAEKFGIQLREYVREIGAYFNVYLSKVKQASTHIMFCDKDEKLYKGNIMLASSGGGITGQDADYLILDDPYTGNDSEFTQTALQQKIDWVNRVVEQRIEPHTKYPISNDCPVYTSNRGWITHGELQVGDKVITPNYTTAKVTHVHPKVKVDNVFCFSNGDKIISGDEHLWLFHEEETNTTQLYPTKDIMSKPLYVDNSYLANHKIPFHSRYISLIDKYKLDTPVEGNCITIDKKDGMYLVGRNYTPTHNCVLHTRWHSNDIIGYYKQTEPDLYEFIEFPAIDDEGKVLWEERYTKEEILKKKEIVGERVFQSVYQQKPIDTTSDFFNIPNLKFGLPEDYVSQQCVRAWDIAGSDALSSNDFTAGVRCHRFDDYFIIDDLVHGRFGNQAKQIIQSTAMSDTPNVKIFIETGVAASGKLLYEEWKNQLQGYIVERAEVSGRANKADRATPFKNALEDGKVYINIEDPNLREAILEELKGFPNMIHDDIVDAIAHAYNALFMNDKMTRKINACFGIIKGL